MGKELIIAGIVVFIIVGLLMLPMVTGIIKLDPNWLRIWAVVITVALPGVFAVGYFAGRSEARSTLDGLDRGVNAVSTMAAQVADIRDRSAQRIHNKPQFNVAMLPQLPKVEHTDLIEGEVQRIDL